MPRFLAGHIFTKTKNKSKINSRLKLRRHLINWAACHLLKETAASAQRPIPMKQLRMADRQAV